MLEICFISLTVLLAIVLFVGASFIANKVIPGTHTKNAFKLKTALLLTGWLAYITILSLKGVFTSPALPPRIPLLLVAPPFLFTFYFFTSPRFKEIIDSIPASWPVYFQCFRILVELLLLGLFLKGLLPKAATLEGYNFDIIMGITAPFLAYFGISKHKAGKTVVIMWNFIGFATLSVVVFILISHAYFYTSWHESGSILNKGFGIFPYTFLAGFFMPLAVFMHVCSIVKTIRR